MDFLSYLNNRPIRYKLLISFSSLFLVAFTLMGLIMYYQIRYIIEDNIERDLQKSTQAILDLVKTSTSVSIKNHLRAVAETNKDIVRHFYQQYKKGQLTEVEAKQRAGEAMRGQTIGKTGYVYVLNSSGVALMHPQEEMLNGNILGYDFIQRQIKTKKGYQEYEWTDPGEKESRHKALYMTYFAAWDWIISVSSYRDEFKELVNTEDFQKPILSTKFGHKGFSFILDHEGTLIIHPKLQGKSYLNLPTEEGRKIFKEILRKKKGKEIHSWKGMDEQSTHLKMVIYNHIPEYNWIVVSVEYLEDLYFPLYNIRDFIIFIVLLSFLLILNVSFNISNSITVPLEKLTNNFSKGTTGDFTFRIRNQSRDEVGQLARYFNLFMERLAIYSADLKQEIRERKLAEESLKMSEEMFSKAFRLNPNGMLITSLQSTSIGALINVNESFLRSTGYSREDCLGHSLQDLKILTNPEEYREIQGKLQKNNSFHNEPVGFLTKSGEPRKGLLSGEVIEIWQEPCLLASLQDVTESIRLEREILEISEKERQSIGQNLHDDLTPHMIGIEVLSKILEKKLERQGLPEAENLQKIRNLIREAIQKTRSMARGLCPVHLVAHGLVPSLRELAQSIQEIFDVNCEVHCDDTILIHENTIATHLFYITQEAIQNAIKHGMAQRIVVRLSLQSGKLMLQISDNGEGFHSSPQTHGMGLRIMNFRARMIAASFDIKAQEQGGTQVTLILNHQQ